MARSKTTLRSRPIRRQRDLFYSIANEPLLPSPVIQVSVPEFLNHLKEFEDGRRFRPGFPRRRVSGALVSTAGVLRIGKVRQNGRKRRNVSRQVLPSGIRFSVPSQLSVCVRRKVRRAVLFSFRKTGGGSSRRKKHRNRFSHIGC